MCFMCSLCGFPCFLGVRPDFICLLALLMLLHYSLIFGAVLSCALLCLMCSGFSWLLFALVDLLRSHQKSR